MKHSPALDTPCLSAKDRALVQAKAALIEARRIIIAAVTMGVDPGLGFDPADHSTVKKIDGALAYIANAVPDAGEPR